jgi:hypothetical protein
VEIHRKASAEIEEASHLAGKLQAPTRRKTAIGRCNLEIGLSVDTGLEAGNSIAGA